MARNKRRRSGRRTARPNQIHPDAAGVDIGAEAVFAAVREDRASPAIRWSTQSLYRSPSSLAQHFRRMRARLGTPQATTATAHKLARIIYHLITHRVAYDDSILAAEERKDLRRFERRLRRQARAIGYELVPEAA